MIWSTLGTELSVFSITTVSALCARLITLETDLVVVELVKGKAKVTLGLACLYSGLPVLLQILVPLKLACGTRLTVRHVKGTAGGTREIAVENRLNSALNLSHFVQERVVQIKFHLDGKSQVLISPRIVGVKDHLNIAIVPIV